MSLVGIRPGIILGFSRRKRLGVFLTPPGWDTSLSQGYFPAECSPAHLGGERHCGTVKNCPRTQRSDPGKGSVEPRPLDGESSAVTREVKRRRF